MATNTTTTTTTTTTTNDTEMASPPSPKAAKLRKNKTTPVKLKHLTRKQANSLVIESSMAIQEALTQLEQVRALAAQAGLSVDCNTLPRTNYGFALADASANSNFHAATSATSLDSPSSMEAAAAAAGLGMPMDASMVTMTTTGGHSNTDHAIVRTGVERIDRVAELRRNLWRRHRGMQPETRQEGRWDKPRLPGERRRRILRERDLPEAPPEPPLSGYIAFLGQMTIKLRHDRPDAPHDQTKVVQEISKLWRIGLSEEERIYYNQFANDARDEYNRQMVEFRATGSYTPNHEFVKVPEVNVWVRKASKRNGLEQEICQYETMIFPKRPARMEEAFQDRQERSLFRRKLRVKGLENPDGSLKDGLDFEQLFRENQEKKGKQPTTEGNNSGTEKEKNSNTSSGEE